jgi:hypothetical protein
MKCPPLQEVLLTSRDDGFRQRRPQKPASNSARQPLRCRITQPARIGAMPSGNKRQVPAKRSLASGVQWHKRAWPTPGGVRSRGSAPLSGAEKRVCSQNLLYLSADGSPDCARPTGERPSSVNCPALAGSGRLASGAAPERSAAAPSRPFSWALAVVFRPAGGRVRCVISGRAVPGPAG